LEKYLSTHKFTEKLIPTSPKKGLFNIIVIPILNEPEIEKYLQSLLDATPPKYNVEIFLILNSSETQNISDIEQNRNSYTQLLRFAKKNNSEKLTFYVFYFENLPKKLAGAGLARKIGMDEAIERFFHTKTDGVITSLDADTYVSKNYFTEIENLFLNNNINGATIYFEHLINIVENSSIIKKSITNYELYLRYYYQALKYTEFPYSYHTLGSAFAVRASAYTKHGGMKANQAGEDFYFLQKIIPMTGFVELNTTIVYPSARPSSRVIFGTGPAVKEISETENQDYFTYNLQSFLDLKLFFSQKNMFFKISEPKYFELISKMPTSINSFLTNINFFTDLTKINTNTTNLKTFTKAFYTKFDAFKIIKFLNQSHIEFYKKEEINNSAKKLLTLINKTNLPAKTYNLLNIYRELEKNIPTC
jgi:hypothetical protein